MTKNPVINALAATLYIVAVVLVMFGISPDDKQLGIAGPIVMLSLFTLSAAVMGYIFLYQPLQLYLDGDKKRGAQLFVHTLAGFAAITALVLFIVFGFF